MPAGSEDRFEPATPSQGRDCAPNRLAPDLRVAGLLLLTAFALPVWDPPLWRFPNLEGLDRGDGFYGFFLVFPLIAGLSLLVISRDRHAGWLRGAFLLGLGLIPFAILLAVPSIHPDAPFYLLFNPKGPSYLHIRAVAGFLGVGALYAGLRGTVIHPGREEFRRLALGGALLLLGLQLLTPHAPNDLLGNRFHSIPDILASLLGLLKAGKVEFWFVSAGSGIGLILYLFCLYRAIEPAFRKNIPDHCRAARQGFTALWLSYVLSWSPQLLVALAQPSEGTAGAAVGMLKLFLWVAGLAMVAPIGLLDYLLVRPRPGADTETSPGRGLVGVVPEEAGSGVSRDKPAGPPEGAWRDTESDAPSDTAPEADRWKGER